MFRFLQARPHRGIVMDLGKDDKFRWRAVEIPERLMDVPSIGLAANPCRTVFTDTVQDGYHSAKHCFRDAAIEIDRWCPINKVSWWMEEPRTKILIRCEIIGTDPTTAKCILPSKSS